MVKVVWTLALNAQPEFQSLNCLLKVVAIQQKKSNIVLRTAFAGEKYPVKMGDSWTFHKNPPYFGSSGVKY